MATYSTSLKLTLIGDGEQSGTWGQTTNTNLGTLLEQAITGVVLIPMVDANYTLTNLNGVSDEARNAVLMVSGANTGVRDIITPAVKKLYVVRNGTSGGFGIRIKTSGGVAVTIPNGVSAAVYCDGTDFYPQSTGAVGSFSTVGNLTVGGSATLSGALVGTTATFSGAISSVSPAFTGTPTAPTAVIGTNSTQIATTGFVQGALGTLGTMASQNANNVNISGGAISGGTVSNITLSATSPTFSGTPTAPTASPGTNTTQIATTAFVQAATGTLGTMSTQNANNVNITGGSVTGVTLSSASASFTGTPTAPTAVTGTSTTQIATTAFVNNSIGAIAAGVSSFSAGTTGFTPSTGTTGNVVLSGTLKPSNGGTGVTTLTGYVYGNGTSNMTASTTIPNSAITGLGTMSTQSASSVAITGGTIEGTAIGASTASTVRGTTITATTGFTGNLTGNASTATTATTATNANSLSTKSGTQPVYGIRAFATFSDNGSGWTLVNGSGFDGAVYGDTGYAASATVTITSANRPSNTSYGVIVTCGNTSYLGQRYGTVYNKTTSTFDLRFSDDSSLNSADGFTVALVY